MSQANPDPCPQSHVPAAAEIVPPDLRNLVYAFDRSFEMAIAALAAPLVGLLAEGLFGFQARSLIRVSSTRSHGQLDCKVRVPHQGQAPGRPARGGPFRLPGVRPGSCLEGLGSGTYIRNWYLVGLLARASSASRGPLWLVV